MYLLARSDARIDKERGMRRKRLRRYIERLKALQGQSRTRERAAGVEHGGSVSTARNSLHRGP